MSITTDLAPRPEPAQISPTGTNTSLEPQTNKPEPDKTSFNVQLAQIPPSSTNTDLEPQTNKPEPDKTSPNVQLAQIAPASTNTDLVPQTNKPEPDKTSLNMQMAQIPPASTNTDLVPGTNKPEPDKTPPNMQLAQIPPTSTNIDLKPNPKPVRIELPKGYEIAELERPKLDEALRQIHLVRNYVDAQVNSMVEQKIADGEFSGGASAECQKYYTAECTLRYWTTEYPRFTRPWRLAMSFQTLNPPAINLADFTVDDLLECLQNFGAPEVMEDLRPLVIHDFEAGGFQPAEEPIERKYTGVTSWVYVSEDPGLPKSFEFTPRLNYYRLWVKVTHTLEDGIPIVMIQRSYDPDYNRIFLDEIGHKMQQFVDAANGIIQDVTDTLLLEAPGQDMTTASSDSAMVPQTDRPATDNTSLIVTGVLPTSITTDSTPQTNRPEPDITVQLARAPPTSTSTNSRLGQRLQQPEGSELRIRVDDWPELDETVAEEDVMAHTEGSSSGHSMDNPTLNPTKKPARNTKKLQQATKRTEDTPAGHPGKARRLGNTSKEMVQTEPEDTDMQENSDGERLDHVGPEQEIHEKEKRPGKKLKSRKHSQSILE